MNFKTNSLPLSSFIWWNNTKRENGREKGNGREKERERGRAKEREKEEKDTEIKKEEWLFIPFPTLFKLLLNEPDVASFLISNDHVTKSALFLLSLSLSVVFLPLLFLSPFEFIRLQSSQLWAVEEIASSYYFIQNTEKWGEERETEKEWWGKRERWGKRWKERKERKKEKKGHVWCVYRVDVRGRESKLMMQKVELIVILIFFPRNEFLLFFSFILFLSSLL